MKIKINNNNDNLYCIYWKELIPIGDRYIEVVEDYLGETIIKVYSYECLQMVIDDYLENYEEEPDILMEDE